MQPKNDASPAQAPDLGPWPARVGMALAITVAAVVLVGLLLGRRWSVEVKAEIAAPASAIHPWIEDLRRWPSWSHWHAGTDSSLRHKFDGAARGVGARWSFAGELLGNGAVEIVRAEPSAGVWLATAIGSESVNGTIALRYGPGARPGTTLLTWRDEGTLPWVIGGFYRGSLQVALTRHMQAALERLKALAEAGQAAPQAPVAADAPAAMAAPSAAPARATAPSAAPATATAP